jgi:SAM-dependent methyltransferase
MKFDNDFTTRSKLKDIGRWYVTRFVQQVAQMLPTGSRVLDAGAGECAYKKVFTQSRYVSVDLAVGEPSWNYHNLSCIGVLDRLPFKDESFDAVLCTQTLEHLEWPRECVREFFRVLKPGGRLFLTVPMTHAEHQAPYDFFRYTSFGIKSICRDAGFAKSEITPFGGMFTRMAYELPRIQSVIPSSGLKAGRLRLKGLFFLPIKVVLLIVIRLVQFVFLALDRFDKTKDYPFGWGVMAQK